MIHSYVCFFSVLKSNGGLPEGEAMRESKLMDRERVREPVSALEREKTIRNLMDMQRKVEQRQQRDRERQLLRVRQMWTGGHWESVMCHLHYFVFQVQERLSIIQSRKAEEDLLGLKHTDRLRHLTQDLPQVNTPRQSVCLVLFDKFCTITNTVVFRRTSSSRRRLSESVWSSWGESALTSCSPNETGKHNDVF